MGHRLRGISTRRTLALKQNQIRLSHCAGFILGTDPVIALTTEAGNMQTVFSNGINMLAVIVNQHHIESTLCKDGAKQSAHPTSAHHHHFFEWLSHFSILRRAPPICDHAHHSCQEGD